MGPPRLRPRARLAVGRLAGRPRRPRAGRLPLDAVLRLRRVPVHRHRHRGRAERHHTAAAAPPMPPWLTGGTSPSASPTSATCPRWPGSAGRGWRSAPGTRSTTPGFEAAFAAVVARRAAAAHVLAGRGRLRAQRVHRGRLDQRRRDRAHAPPRRPAGPDRARRQRVRAGLASPTAACPRRCSTAVVEHARDRRYRRLLLAPTAGSTAFYRRAGFVPAGESLLALDPAT